MINISRKNFNIQASPLAYGYFQNIEENLCKQWKISPQFCGINWNVSVDVFPRMKLNSLSGTLFTAHFPHDKRTFNSGAITSLLVNQRSWNYTGNVERMFFSETCCCIKMDSPRMTLSKKWCLLWDRSCMVCRSATLLLGSAQKPLLHGF